MASIKQLTERKYKITISNGYRNGKKICKSQTIQVPKSVASRSIRQYVMHEAEELERRFKYGFSEDGSTAFQDYAEGWLSRQSKYAPSTLASYRRQLEVVYPYIGAIPLCKLRPLAIENMLTQLRKRKNRTGQPIQETTVQHYLSAASAVLSDAKRNEIIQKNPARMIDLPAASHVGQHIPTVEEAQHLLQALAREPRHFRVFYLLAMATGCRRGELCALRWSDFCASGNGFILTVSRSRSIVAGKGVVEGSTKTVTVARSFSPPPCVVCCSVTAGGWRRRQQDTAKTQSLSVRQLGRDSHSPRHIHKTPAEDLRRQRLPC